MDARRLGRVDPVDDDRGAGPLEGREEGAASSASSGTRRGAACLPSIFSGSEEARRDLEGALERSPEATPTSPIAGPLQPTGKTDPLGAHEKVDQLLAPTLPYREEATEGAIENRRTGWKSAQGGRFPERQSVLTVWHWCRRRLCLPPQVQGTDGASGVFTPSPLSHARRAAHLGKSSQGDSFSRQSSFAAVCPGGSPGSLGRRTARRPARGRRWRV